MEMPQVANFFGWCTLINFGLLVISTVLLMTFRRTITRIHSKLCGVDEERLPILYFNYLANFKLLIIVFNLVPYIALRLLVS